MELEKVEQMQIREDLLNLIGSLSPEETKQAYELLRERFTDISVEEMEKWWAQNMEVKPHAEQNLSDAELREIEEDEYKSWKHIRHKYDGEE